MEEKEQPTLSQLKTITPFSKFLAIILFIITPFIGAWIGYTNAPIKIIEVTTPAVTKGAPVTKIIDENIISSLNIAEKFVIEEYECDIHRDNSSCFRLLRNNDGQIAEILSDLATAYQDITQEERVFVKQFFSTSTEQAYFKSFNPNSNKCCEIVKFTPENQQFQSLDLAINPNDGNDVLSPNQRYLARTLDNSRLVIFDITTESIIASVTIQENETLWSSCGHDGAHSNVTWNNNSELTYGVYDPTSFDNNPCEGNLIESRNLSISQ